MRDLKIIVTAIASLLLVTGCGGKVSPMNYHRLAPENTLSSANEEKLPELVLGVEPITIPEMLKRQEIIIRTDATDYRLTEQHRWAGLLEKDLSRVVGENLSQQLGTTQVAASPWPNYFVPEFRVSITILELSGNPEQQVTLRAIWTIVDRSGEQMLVRNISEYEQKPAERTINSMVQAQSQLVAKLCQEISTELRLLAAR